MPIAPRPNNKAGKIVKKILKVRTKGEMDGNRKEIPPTNSISPTSNMNPIGLGTGGNY